LNSSKRARLADIAKDLRRRSTEAEKALWRTLRNRQLGGFKFRRQQFLGPFIVDFACLEARLVIEVDGGQHAVDKEKDEERDTWLRGQGFQILRFWNHEVLGNIDGVLETIRQRLTTPSPNPSHQGRGDRGLGDEHRKIG
jgi:very-short-patch-repair endonuclease